ncbi:MAG: hypothetical protein IKZ89_03780 [Bacteroidaceae bacterium]|nr:hypothetical protein [Bacteroidaceae bacterium]
MKKFLSTLLLILPLTQVFAQEQNAGTVNVSQPQKQWYEGELFLQNIRFGSQNPVSITSNPYSQLNDFSISYSMNKGSFMPVDGAGKSGMTDVNIYGVRKVKNISFEGSLYYGVHQLDDSRWNSTVLLSENNPFIIADSLVYYKKATHEDSIPNNQSRELFNLNGGFSWQTGKLTTALRANYLVGNKADQSDPRFKANGARVTFNPGVEYNVFNNIYIGLSATYQVYHENIGMSAKDHLFPGHQSTFFLQELGNYIVEQSCSRRYDGTKVGGDIQFVYSGSKFSDILEVGYITNNENADDGGTSYTKHGGDYSESTLSFRNRFQIHGDILKHSLTISGGMLNGKCKWYKQNSKKGDFGETLYEVASTEIVQKQNEMFGDLSYRLDYLNSQRPSVSIVLNGGYKSVKINEYPDEYFVKYTLTNIGMDLSKYLYFGKLSFKLTANFDYCKDLTKLDYSFPTSAGKSKVINSYYIPKYQYLGAGYWNGGLSVDGSYKINRNEQSSLYVKFGGSYNITKYTGDYSRFQDRNQAEIRTSLYF